MNSCVRQACRRYETISWTLCIALGILSAGSAYLVNDGREAHLGTPHETLSLLQLRSSGAPVGSATAPAHTKTPASGSLPAHAAHHHDAIADLSAGLADRMVLFEYLALLVFVAASICAMKRALHPEDEKTAALHLITARGFLLQVFISMMIFYAAAALASRLPATQNDCPFHTAVELLVAQKKGVVVTVWSVFGLVSSSCCAVQLVLNVFNIGCAGFNTVLGPWRPVFIGLTAALQTAVWAHVYLNPHMWYMAAVGSLVAFSLSFLPEFLHFFALSHAIPIARDESLFLTVDGMGCAACTSAVRSICTADARVMGCTISFEERLVHCALAGKSDGLADELCLRLTAAGFNAKPATHAATDVKD